MTRTTVEQRVKISVTECSLPRRQEFLSKIEQFLLQSESHRMKLGITKTQDYDERDFSLVLHWLERH